MHTDPFDTVVSLISGFIAFVLIIIWLVFISSVSRSLKCLCIEAEKQTALLSKIDRNTSPPVAPDAKPTAPVNYIREAKPVLSAGFIVGLLAVIALILFIAAMSKGH